MVKKEMIAMLLAGGQGSRLGVFTSKVAKPAVAFGGKYRIIDFPLSNCINSGVDTVGVLTQYQPLRLNTHIGIGIPWDLDRNIGGVTVLPPYEKSVNSEWYTGTANAIYQNLDYMESYNPEYVLILSGDHIYKIIRYKDPRPLGELPRVQRGILDNCAQYVRPGGVLLYSTCTVLPRENGDVVDGFLADHPEFVPEPFQLPHLGEQPGRITFWPHIHGTDGFFAAKLRKRG